ncbi:MAG: DUF1592 domain-containing protein [Verrucomicrobiales bacterium]|nr:DUF1592 domain-containing protein [Verrucomicrobiales bacterium]
MPLLRCVHTNRLALRLARFRGVLLLGIFSALGGMAESAPRKPSPNTQFISQYCLDCHDTDAAKGGINLEGLDPAQVEPGTDLWERVVRKVATRQMPPPGKRRPDDRESDRFVTRLASALDLAAAKSPEPGRTDTIRRLNRIEYQNAIRDLLGLHIDAAALLPKDDASHGFDNVTVGDLSPTLLDRYIAAAQKISRLAVGSVSRHPGGETFRFPADLTQDYPVEGLPLGTRGGGLLPCTFPRDGTYEFQIRLARDRNEAVEGLSEPHELVLLLDRAEVQRFAVTPPPGPNKDYDHVDAHLKVRLPVSAGRRQMGVTFLKNPSALLETRRQPHAAHFNFHRHPRLGPAVYQVSITGPYDSTGPGDTDSRRQLFAGKPQDSAHEEAFAAGVLKRLMQRAYRRPITPDDLESPLQFYREAREENGFEAGMEAALAAVLVSPNFLFRVERDPPGIQPGTAYHLADLELASRLSFFLWSSLPDDALLTPAFAGDLHQPRELARQTRRMLADPRAGALASNFASQWLQTRNLDAITPDLRLFPDFDDNLRQAFRRETELFVDRVRREDRSILEFIKSDGTYLNERLARHYDVPHIYGSHFRWVPLHEVSRSGGLLRQGSVLTVTSYATRTSPVLRGKWILDNLLGSPPPPPLPNVPALRDNTVSATASVRARLAEHRANPACASCHDVMDPVGFALENFDAVGRWRILEDGQPVDSSGGLPDGRVFDGVAGLESGLLDQPELFAQALTEKLLIYALGRGLSPKDAPAVRKIVRDAAKDHYRFSSIILGIVQSLPFTQRKSL